MSDLRAQLLAAFREEYREHVEVIRAALARAKAGSDVDLREIFRRAHSLKGAARAVDLGEVETAAHAMEESFAHLLGSGGQLDATHIEAITIRLDQVERVSARALSPGLDASVDTQKTPQDEYVRVNAVQVQSLSAALNDLTGHLDLLEPAAETLQDLKGRMSDLARSIEHLLLEPALNRVVLSAIAQETRNLARSIGASARMSEEAARLAMLSGGRVREEVERLALAPASTIFGGLDAMLREIADELGRKVEVTTNGLDILADRRLLQSLRDPVIQLLRNAVSHGIEPPDVRRRAGKPETGHVSLTLRSVAGRFEVVVSDDGQGPDLAGIERTAIRRGLLRPRSDGEAPRSVEQLLALVFETGFSTATKVDQLSGRGIGLSIVAGAARRAGGGAFMRVRPAGGAEVSISAPLSAARQPVLLIEHFGQTYGLPTRAVEQVIHIPTGQLKRIDARQTVDISVAGNQVSVPVVPLNLMMGAGGGSLEDVETVSIAIVRQGDQRLGVRVDSFSDVRTLTISALLHEDVDDIVQGAIQLEQGRVAIVVNPESLMRRYYRDEFAWGTSAPVAKKASLRRRTVLVVDDSMTTRTLQKSILEASGYRTILAVDGLDGLEKARAHREDVDIVVADVEMPGMDGFQLLGALKSDPALAGLPVIMMTSRAAPEDVRRGLDLGADAYLTKQAFDQGELLETVGRLL